MIIREVLQQLLEIIREVLQQLLEIIRVVLQQVLQVLREVLLWSINEMKIHHDNNKGSEIWRFKLKMKFYLKPLNLITGAFPSLYYSLTERQFKSLEVLCVDEI